MFVVVIILFPLLMLPQTFQYESALIQRSDQLVHLLFELILQQAVISTLTVAVLAIHV